MLRHHKILLVMTPSPPPAPSHTHPAPPLLTGRYVIMGGTAEYFVSLPANKLELWMALESGRFMAPVFRQLYSEKEVRVP